MNFYFSLFIIAVILWAALCVIMLPVYWIRKKKNPNDEKNTLTSLLWKSFWASIIFVLVFYSGLILMNFEENL